MVKRSIDQKLRLRNFERLTRENWNRSSGGESKGLKWRWKRKRYMLSVERKRPVFERVTNAVSGMRVTIVRKNQNTMPPHLASQPYHEVEVASKKRSIRGNSNHGAILGQPCRYYLKGTCSRSLCEYWHPPSVNFTKQKRTAKPGISVCSRIIRLMNNQTKEPKKGYYFTQKKRKRRQECCDNCENCTTIGLRLPRLGSIGFSKRRTVPVKPDAKKSLGPIRRARFTQSTVRQASMRHDFLDFDMLDAMIASALKKLLNTQILSRKRVSVEEQRA